MAKNSLFIITAYLLVYTIWSSTYLAMKIGIETFSTYLFVGIRWLFSGLVIFAASLIIYKRKIFTGVTKKQAINSALLGIVLLILGNSLLLESQKLIDSHIAAIFLSTTPILMAIFDYFINRRKLSLVFIPAVVLGIFGVSFLIIDKFSISSLFNFYIILLILAAGFWSFGSALSHKLEIPKNSFVNTFIQMLSASICAFIIYFLQGSDLMPELSRLSSHSISALLYLIIFGSIGMIAYFYLIKHEPLSRVSTYCFVNAVGAVIIGVFIGKEELSKNFFIAFSFVLVSIVLMLKAMVKEDNREKTSDAI